MTRKRANVTDADVTRWIRQGYGQGEGDTYKSWFKIRDVPSIGRSTRIASLRHQHTHQLLSDVEAGHFLIADYRSDVREIRDQIALLPREETIRIAEELKIRHPSYPGTFTPIVMTSDIWVDRWLGSQSKPYILCVKREESLRPNALGLKRTIEKLAIERRFWIERGIDWHLVTQNDICARVVLNLGLLRPSRKTWHSERVAALGGQIAETIQDPRSSMLTLRQVLGQVCKVQEQAYEAFGLAVWKRWINLDLRREQRWDAPLTLYRVAPA